MWHRGDTEKVHFRYFVIVLVTKWPLKRLTGQSVYVEGFLDRADSPEEIASIALSLGTIAECTLLRYLYIQRGREIADTPRRRHCSLGGRLSAEFRWRLKETTPPALSELVVTKGDRYHHCGSRILWPSSTTSPPLACQEMERRSKKSERVRDAEGRGRRVCGMYTYGSGNLSSAFQLKWVSIASPSVAFQPVDGVAACIYV